MRFFIEWAENKNNDWKIVSVKDLTGAITTDVSVNRVNKKGETFPNFDNIRPGAEIEAEFWTSTAGKHYLFAPNLTKAASAGVKNGNMVKVMEQKAQNIEKSQDRKEEGIRTSSTIRMAVDLAIAEHDESIGHDLKESISRWRMWLLKNWDLPTNDLPF